MKTSAPALAALARAKAVSISVCLPARDEEETVGAIVAEIRSALADEVGLVSEILVADDGSRDATASEAAAGGARVISTQEVLPAFGRDGGKGAALWKSLFASTGDVVCWVDADITGFDADFVVRLVAPLVAGEADFAKGHYRRSGGRVTELTAKPLIRRFLPHLAAFPQPLSGEFAGRRHVLERLRFEPHWGVDLALLADVVDLVGLDRVAAVDLGEREHKNRPLSELADQAEQVVDVVLSRAGIVEAGAAGLPPIATLPARAQEAG